MEDLSIGSEIGHSKRTEMAKRSPALGAISRKFGMVHGLSSLGSMVSFGSLDPWSSTPVQQARPVRL
jgi:hypothetical protein